MSTTRRRNRPYLRQTRALAARRRGTADLAESAGMIPRPAIEALEPRQLLFSLTITPSDVNQDSGLGTVTAHFGYTIPYLLTQEEIDTNQEADVVLEDFNGRLPDPQAGTPIGSGTQWQSSGLRVEHNILPNSNFRIIGEVDDQGQPVDNTGKIFVRIASSQFFRFDYPNNGLMSQMTMEVAPEGGALGIDVDTMVVRLQFLGETIASYTGQELQDLSTGPNGTGVFTFALPEAEQQVYGGFTEIEFFSLGSSGSPFTIDNVQATFPAAVFADVVESRVFGAQAVLSGPVGASAQFLDLYGEDLIETIRLGKPQGSDLALVDPNDDGVPNFNDGIGSIQISGGDRTTSFTMFGGTIDYNETPPPDADFVEGGFVFTLVDSLDGYYDDFEDAGFGYYLTPDDPPTVQGLAPLGGSVIVGSPFIRDNSSGANYNTMGLAATWPVRDGFVRPDQGIFVEDGRSIASVYIDGIMYGSSRFTGALDRFVVNTMMGSLSVEGDLGAMIVSGDAGLWMREPDVTPNIAIDEVVVSQSQLVVGRTVGEIAVAGRSLMDVTVVGDLNNATTRPPRDIFRYYEKEYNYGLSLDLTAKDTILGTIGNTDYVGINQAFGDFFFRRIDQALIFGEGYFRNDTIMSAEWIGSSSTAVRIQGDIGFGDPVSTAEDPSDVYAFATDGERPINIEIDASAFVYVRVVDQDGRTLAALELADNLQNQQFLRYDPESPGVYYVVVSESIDNDVTTGRDYVMTVSGIAPTTLGAYRTGAGFSDQDIPDDLPTITLISGNMGSLRVGTGYVDGGGAEVSPLSLMNTLEDDDDDLLTMRGMTVTVPGNLYNITTGSDINTQGNGVNSTTAVLNLLIGGNFGTLVTGLSPISGVGPTEGDISSINMFVGGSIAMLDIRGAIGIDQDPDPDVRMTGGFMDVVINTGTSGEGGDIGMIRVGSHVSGGVLHVNTPAGSTIGGFLVSQDIGIDSNNFGIYGFGFDGNAVDFNTGAGSDVRFVDFPRIDQLNAINTSIPLFGGQPVEITDDAGGRIRIEILGGTSPFGLIRVLPIDQSEGVAIGQIEADLSGGARLLISGLSDASGDQSVSIGRINITGADANSTIGITGQTEIDIWQIMQSGGGAFDLIENLTPGGDLVAVDVVGLNRLTIEDGDLGRTKTNAWGPKLIGPALGVQAGLNTAVGGALGVNPATLITQVAGTSIAGAYAPVNRGAPDPNAPYLDDIGSPLDPWLDGLVVRTGDITEVSVSGAVGDVIAQGGDLILLTANSDSTTAPGRFDGIIGNIYANDVHNVQIGDGLVARTSSPMINAGIFADDDIILIQGGEVPGAYISGVISASNINPLDPGPGGDLDNLLNGIQRIELTGGGDFIDTYISSEQLDGFWISFYIDYDAHAMAGNIDDIAGTDADFYRSEIYVANLLRFQLNDGVYDASQIHATGRVDSVETVGYRNTTLTGGNLEFRRNVVEVAEDLGLLTTFGREGDISDLTIDVLGSVTGEISGRNFSRVDLDVDNRLQALTASNIRGSDITLGDLPSATISDSIRASSFHVSGAITSMTADIIANTEIAVTGPDGRIVSISAGSYSAVDISASGPIDSIVSTAGDIDGRITTTTDKGTLNLIQAARDLNVNTDISAGVNQFLAGRNVGDIDNPGVILVRGDLNTIDASAGHIYSDIRIGQDLTGSIIMGREVNLPGNSRIGIASFVAFGRLNNIQITGDFAGSIISESGGIGSVTITGGSFLPNGTITAHDGNIDSLTINNGHLLGDVWADYDITSLRIAGGPVFGDIGIRPGLSDSTSFDAFRNQLPPGVEAGLGFNGPTIYAGHTLVDLTLTNGTIFESSIIAGQRINNIQVFGGASNDGRNAPNSGFGTVIIGGETVGTVHITQAVNNTIILAGVTDLGADDRPGGVGVNADRVAPGVVESVVIGGDAAAVAVSAGFNAGADGRYNTADDTAVLGRSFVQSVTVAGTKTGVSVYSETASPSVSGGITIGGLSNAVADADIFQGDASLFTLVGTSHGFTLGADSGTISFAGPGSARWDAAGGRVILVNTTTESSLTVTSSTGTLTDFDIVSVDDASIGTVTINADVSGDSDLVIDGQVTSITFGSFSGTGSVRIGGDVGSFTSDDFTGGFISAQDMGSITITGDFGVTTSASEATITLLSAGTITISGGMHGRISVDRNATSIDTGPMQRGLVRVGESLDSLTSSELSESRVSVGDVLGPVTIAGQMFDSAIIAGADLGQDVGFGGTGVNEDHLTSGSIGAVTIGGGFGESDIIAGIARGPDGFYGTADDSIAAGRSHIASVTIAGTDVGSSLFSESYRIAATGSIGTVLIGGTPGQASLNFDITVLDTNPIPIQIDGIKVTQDSNIYTAEISFNQRIDASTIGRALSVLETRGAGDVLLRLVENLDYTISYDANQDTAAITFDSDITSRDLPQLSGVPGPGLYRFHLDTDFLRAAVNSARLDGNGDGFAIAGDDYSQDDIVGDAGDKAFGAGGITVILDPNTQEILHRVDFYEAVNLDVLLDDNHAQDGLPDANVTFTVRGSIGDHPDNDINYFRFAGDNDVYAITLQAGQILHLGAMQGAALAVGRGLYSAADVVVNSQAGDPQALGLPGTAALSLPNNAPNALALTFEDVYLIKETGLYYIVVSNATGFTNQSAVPNLDPIPGAISDYNFTIEIFDDGNSGFNASTDSGDGTTIVDPPSTGLFAGADGIFGTADDQASIVIGAFTFTLDNGADGVPGTTDDLVTGTNGSGITSTRSDGQIVSTISSAIGPDGHTGVPVDIYADIDVYHLASGLRLDPGSRVRVTVKLTELGGDLGSRIQLTGVDLTGNVQFGIFDTTDATGLEDALLVLAPTDFNPNGGTPGVIADNGTNSYGYDDNGDFYVDFATPGRIGADGTEPASYAIYLQGALQTDYVIEVAREGSATLVKHTQNIFLETRGGQIDWLETGNRITELDGFTASDLGFTGRFDGQGVNDYILSNLVTALTEVYAAAGIDVNISTNSADFEFQDFSTVFLSTTNDPVNFIFELGGGIRSEQFSDRFSNQPYGHSQHSDMLNTDLNDEAVVFLPSFATLGFTPSQADADLLVDSLTGAIGRRVGELLGLRVTADDQISTTYDTMAANSVTGNASENRTHRYSTIDRALSQRFDSIEDTDFFLGIQNAGSLLDKIIASD